MTVKPRRDLAPDTMHYADECFVLDNLSACIEFLEKELLFEKIMASEDSNMREAWDLGFSSGYDNHARFKAWCEDNTGGT